MGILSILRIGKIFPLLYKYWWILFILFYILPTAISSIDMAKEQGDWMIPVRDAGIALASFDEGIGNTVEGMEFEFDKKDSLSEKIDGVFSLSWYLIRNLWKSLFAMIFSFLIVFKVWLYFGGGDTSKWRKALLSTIITMFLLQIIVFGTPFKGTISLIKFIIEVFRKL